MTPAAVNPSYGAVLLDAIAGVVIFVALVRVITTPSAQWARGRRSKIAWALAAVWLNPTAGSVIWPVAAGVAIWYTHRLSRTPQSEPAPLPHASGARDDTANTDDRSADDQPKGQS